MNVQVWNKSSEYRGPCSSSVDSRTCGTILVSLFFFFLYVLVQYNAQDNATYESSHLKSSQRNGMVNEPPTAGALPVTRKRDGSSGGSILSRKNHLDISAYSSQRFLHPMQILEGFGAWSDAIHEMIELAIYLNRTLIEPCVRNGCIEPCRCNSIHYPPPFDQEAAERGEDPLLLPYIPDPCKIDRRPPLREADHVSPSYPLSAYMDLDELLTTAYPQVNPQTFYVTYQSWCEAHNASLPPPYTEEAVAVRAPHHRFRSPAVLCYDFAWCDGQEFILGDFVFGAELSRPSRDDILTKMGGEQNVYISRFYRGAFLPANSRPSVPLNKWHVAAVRRFIAQVTRGENKYVAFHWRSEQVDPTLLPGCSKSLAPLTKKALNAAKPGGRSIAGILVADMPAPGTQHVMWTDYIGGDGNEQKMAMATMMKEGGLAKYDATVENVDAGVLSLRDYLISVMADYYVSCQGDHDRDCHSCFRAGSNIVLRITNDRDRERRPYSTKWYSIDYEGVMKATNT